MEDPEKHSRYLTHYKANDLFWGIGIENETYLQFSTPQKLNASQIYNNHAPERYSVSYFKSYRPEYKNHIKLLYPDLSASYELPVYINSHSFQKMDLAGNHQTVYSKTPFPNPNFSGETIHEFLCRTDPIVFKRKFKRNYVYDGDTIEFMTQRYYKTTIQAAVEELQLEKLIYLKALNSALRSTQFLPPQTECIYPPKNAAFVIYQTNPTNISTFNNGTYHLNFTLPTQLGSDSKPVNQTEFVTKHRNAIRYIQALEPLIIAMYGTPDPFAATGKGNYSHNSQRATVSRYIGIGTYDTNKMPTGKILTEEIKRLKFVDLPFWWYSSYHANSSYHQLEKIGMDINFNKHGNHGIELRFLDWFPENRLLDLLTTLVHLFDFSLQTIVSPPDPTILIVWNQIVIKSIQGGPQAKLSKSEVKFYADLFKFLPPPNEQTIASLYNHISKHLTKYVGICVSCMIDPNNINKRSCTVKYLI